MRRAAAIICLWSILLGPGCSTYKPTVTPFKLPEAYANMQRVADTYVGARTWVNDAEARAAFGFDILGAGILPVQVSFDNRGGQTLVIVPTLHMDEGIRRMLLAVSLESVAFLLAMKILLRRQPHRNSMIAAGFLLALALIVVKGFLFTGKAGNVVASIVGASARNEVSAPAVVSDRRSADDSNPVILSPSRSVH